MNASEKENASNPFPRIAVATSPDKHLPNYLTDSQISLFQLGKAFADRFASPTPRGMTFGIRGAVGSGKTHTLFQMAQQVREAGQPATKFVYLKALDARSVLEFYRTVFPGNLSLDDFRDMASQHYVKLLETRVGSPESPEAAAVAEAGKRLQQGDLQYLLKLIEADLIPAIDLERERENELSEPGRLEFADLTLAYAKVFDREFGQYAVQWLQGKEIGDGPMRDLGLKSRIASNADALLALRFMLDAYRHARIPVMLVVDEIERTVLTNTDTPDAVGRNLLKDVAEAMQTSGHLFGVCGQPAAWDKMTSDFYGRVSRADVIEIRLKPSEADELIHAWEQASGPEAPSAFDSRSLSSAIGAAEGNPRRLLEIAHHSWNIWSSTDERRITPAQVREATRKVVGDTRRRDSALQAARNRARMAGLLVSVSELGRYDLALARSGRTVAYVKVTMSVFKDDEIDDARALIEARRTTLSAMPGVGTCVVLAGYSSPAVVEQLERNGDHVIRYDEQAFDTEFAAYLDTLRQAEPPRSPAAAAPALADDALRAQATQNLDLIATQSRAEVQAVQRSLDAVQAQKVQRLDEGFSTSSAQKLADTIEELTSLLGEESRLLAVPAEHEDVKRLRDKQRSLVQYATFLDRIVPQSDQARSLEEFTHLVDQPDFHKDQNYRGRLDLLRTMHACLRKQPEKPADTMRWRARLVPTLAILGVAGLFAYLLWGFISFIGDSRVLKAYQSTLEDLPLVTIQQAKTQGNTQPLRALQARLPALRQAYRATFFPAYPRAQDQAFDQALLRYLELLDCANDVSAANLTRCESIKGGAVMSELSGATDRILEALDARAPVYMLRFIEATGLWLLLMSLLIIPQALEPLQAALRVQRVDAK